MPRLARRIDFRDDDVVILTMKSQDTHEALHALRDAGARNQAIVCGQNGVANERAALRLFANVYGMTVVSPGTYLTPGEVLCHAKPKRGLFDLGRLPPPASTTRPAPIAAHLDGAEFKTFLFEDVMRSKYGKLLENQTNIVKAALGNRAVTEFDGLLKAEGQAAYRAAGSSGSR
ncbi:MAG: 2-dehydropantoate 2-reductase N-terminal domain-containing protein [Hyphomicrobium sp.]